MKHVKQKAAYDKAISLQTQYLDKLNSSIEAYESGKEAVDFTNLQKTGNEILSAKLSEINPDNIEELKEKLKDKLLEQDEVQEALNKIPGHVEDDEAEAMLEELMNENTEAAGEAQADNAAEEQQQEEGGEEKQAEAA